MKKVLVSCASLCLALSLVACHPADIAAIKADAKKIAVTIKAGYDNVKEGYVVVKDTAIEFGTAFKSDVETVGDDLRTFGRTVSENMSAACDEVKAGYVEFIKHDTLSDWQKAKEAKEAVESKK